MPLCVPGPDGKDLFPIPNPCVTLILGTVNFSGEKFLVLCDIRPSSGGHLENKFFFQRMAHVKDLNEASENKYYITI